MAICLLTTVAISKRKKASRPAAAECPRRRFNAAGPEVRRHGDNDHHRPGTVAMATAQGRGLAIPVPGAEYGFRRATPNARRRANGKDAAEETPDPEPKPEKRRAAGLRG